MSNITDKQLIDFFDLKTIDGFYGIDQNNNKHFLVDLRKDYKKHTQSNIKKEIDKQKKKLQIQENISDVFVMLDRAFPEYKVLIRESQPGLNIPELGLNVYCIIGATDRHVISCYSKKYTQEELNDLFAYYKLYKKDNDSSGVTISGIETDHIIELIQFMIKIHK